MEPFYVSSPGKVIIFGEHSAVYGKPAIAAALDLRAYLLVRETDQADTITLHFPDIQLQRSWKKLDIPWAEIHHHVKYVDGKPQPTPEIVPEIVELLLGCLNDIDSRLHYVACHCFLYLYTQLSNDSLPGLTFTIRSTLPIGAGLGSSAATAVCLASAFAILGQHVLEAGLKVNEKNVSKTHEDAEFIDRWSLMGEMCFHGNPSGIDNAVATHGGAVMFQRMKDPAVPSVRTNMRNFPSLNLLLTNTKIPRSTAALVSGVASINVKYTKTAQLVLEAMEHLVNDAYQIMIKPFFGSEETQQLRDLININHGLLVALGVSHPSLERIRAIGDEHNIGATKLTGAGGGGCAITLLADDVDEKSLAAAKAVFAKNGFETFQTSLGGKGVGLLHSSSVDEAVRSQLFSPEVFVGYNDRDDIQQALGVQEVSGWRFW